MCRLLLAAVPACLTLSAWCRVPRGEFYQKGGDLTAAVAAGFGIVIEVTTEGGGLSPEVGQLLDIIPGGRKAIIDWQTSDPSSLDQFSQLLENHPALFEKDYIFSCTNGLARKVHDRFDWPRHMPGYRISDNAVDALSRFRRGEIGIVIRDAEHLHAEMLALEREEREPADEGTWLARELGRPFLPNNAAGSSRASVYSRVAELDAAADSRWRSLTSRLQYDEYRAEMRGKMMKALGAYPARSPLNFRVVRSVPFGEFRVDLVTYESMPNLVVPACLYVPKKAGLEGGLPAVVISCGHGEMNYSKYALAAKELAIQGIVALVFEAYEQGEREQYSRYNCCQNHNLIGLKAMLLGSSFAMLRIWDGMRAIDCLEELPYVDRERIGYMGQSGGGTMTSLMMAADDRIKAAAPSGFLTSFAFLCKTLAPGDAEQNIFGQLGFGLNMTGYVLMPDIKVLVTGKFGDFFPYGGTVELMGTVGAVAEMLGNENHYAMNFAPGPHSWAKSTVRGSVQWMKAWLDGQSKLLPLDMQGLRELDFTADISAETRELTGPDMSVLGGKSSTALLGARDIHDVLRDWFAAARSGHRERSAAEMSVLVKKFAGIRSAVERSARVIEMGECSRGDLRLSRLAFMYPDGFAVPAVLLERADLKPTGSPLLLVGARGRVQFVERTIAALANGRPVLVADVIGTGEIIRMERPFYDAYDTPEEDISVMLYLLGESMVGRRAEEILDMSGWLKGRFGRGILLVSEGSVSVAAAHAYASEWELYDGVEASEAPPSWSEFVEKTGEPLQYRYTWCVNGALREYDWVDLIKR